VAAAWALVLAAAPAPLRAQQPPPAEPIDRIVAIVGDRPILLSEVDEELLLAQSPGQVLPTDSAARNALRRQALERMIDEEVLYQHARLDTTIVVSDADVQNAVEQQARQVRGQFQSESDYRAQLRAAGFGTPEEYRRWLAERQRRTAYQQRYLEKLRGEGRLRGLAPSETEMRRAFTDMTSQGQPQMRPAMITFRQIVVAPVPTPLARAAAFARAESALAEVRGGADFAVVARRLSDDRVSRELGGDMGWFRRGTMVRAFDRVAFSLRPGQTSEIVATPYGYHIIQVERVQPGEVKARHILISPVITQVELDAAQRIADTVAARLHSGVNFDSLHTLYGDTAELKQVGPLPRTQLAGSYAVYGAAMEGLSAGDVSPVFALAADDSLRTKFVVAVLDDVAPERPYRFEDQEVRDRLRSDLQQQRAVRDLMRSLRRQTYVDNRF